MHGNCDACGRHSQFSDYTRRWFGDVSLTSQLCSDCLTSIRKRPNTEGERLAPPKRPRTRSGRTEKASNWAKYRDTRTARNNNASRRKRTTTGRPLSSSLTAGNASAPWARARRARRPQPSSARR